MSFKTLFLTLALACGAQTLHAQETPKTLLWRISGNGFTNPCYLYGTMHSNDKRLYYLGDSVYAGIKSCEGFSMEVDPADNVDTLLNSIDLKQLNIAYKENIEKNLVKKDPSYFKRRQWELDSMYNRIKQRYNDLSSRDLARLRRAYRQRDRNDMNTTVDLYLFDLAKTQGKVMGGLEDIAGRAALLDEIGNKFDADQFLKNQRKKYVDVYEWMVVNYTAAELDKLHEFSRQGQTDRENSLMLYNRNAIMAKRIDSLGKLRSTFAAVGASHLPGDSGVISLLRRNGFTVEPVFSSKKIEPGDYKIEKRLNTLISISDNDSNYVVQMPGKPTDLTAITNKHFLKTYKELANEILLMVGVYEDGDMNKTIDKEVEDIKNSFRWSDIKLYSTHKINRQGLEGYELNFKHDETYFRLHLFHKTGKTYMFASGSKTKDSLKATRSENYMASYHMNLDRAQAEVGMIAYVNAGKAFSVSLPTQPRTENITGAITVTKEDITLFSSVDLKKKISYLVLLKEPFRGYFNDFDSSIFNQTISEVLKNVTIRNVTEENVLLDNYPALKIKVRGEVEGKVHVIYTILSLRHNRLYNLTARGLAVPGNELLFDNFINSFKFIPYQQTTFTRQQGGNNLFSVMAPSPINILKNKNTGNPKRTDYYAYNESTAMSYGITALALDKYYWTPNTKSLLKEYSRIHFNDSLAVKNILGSDSLVYKKDVQNGNTESVELLLKTLFNNSYSRIRIMHYADSVFVINIKGPQEMVTNADADNFFTSFRFTSENPGSRSFTSKTDQLLRDLQSTDAATYKPAAEALKHGLRFPAQDLPKMLEALLFNYTGNEKGINIPVLLSKTVESYTGEKLYGFIKTNYPALKGKREDIRMLMINILSAANDQEAYQVLKGFLLTDPPASGNYSTALSHFSRLPRMAHSLFPELAVKLKDDDMAFVVLELANMLIDSNKIQIAALREYEDDITRLGKKLLKKYKDNNSESNQEPYTMPVLQMLNRVNNKQSKAILNELAELQNYNLTLQIILSKAKNDLPVSAGLIDWYSSSPSRQVLLYDELLKIGRQSFFTGQYANQRSFAEAFTRMFTTNEIDNTVPKYYDLVAIKDATVKNNVSRFYIYKITCQFRRGTQIFTAIMGPFSTNPSAYSIKEGKELYILYRKPFDTNNMDTLFHDFIEQVKKMR